MRFSVFFPSLDGVPDSCSLQYLMDRIKGRRFGQPLSRSMQSRYLGLHIQGDVCGTGPLLKQMGEQSTLLVVFVFGAFLSARVSCPGCEA